MVETDFFGTFLDTVSSSLKGNGRGNRVAPTPQSSPLTRLERDPAAAGAAAGALAGAAAGALAGEEARSKSNPPDAIVEALLQSAAAGKEEVDLKSLLPTAENSLTLLLRALQQLETFGIVERTSDNMIRLTRQGRTLQGAFMR